MLSFSFGVTGEGLNVIGVTGKLAVSLCYYYIIFPDCS